MRKIVLTGGTGYIGRHLIDRLKSKYEFIVLTRYPQKYKNTRGVSYYKWDGKQELTHYLENSYAVVNLLGENIGLKPWTPKQKRKILSSRINAAEAIRISVESCNKPPKVWVQASATGYYGQIGNTGVISDEGSLKKENSFLADVCEKWEAPIQKCGAPIRKVIIRTGVVLSRESMLLKQLLLPFFLGMSVTMGKGVNSLPWISLEDETRAIEFLLDQDYLKGVFNLVSPCDNTMNDLISEIKKYKFTWLSFKIPRGVLELIFGKEKVAEIILTDQRVAPKALMNTVFEFKHPKLVDCIAWCFKSK